MRTLIKFWLKFRLFWSKWRWRKAVTEYPLAERHIFHGMTPEELYVFILNLTNELHAKFKYTYDDITQLADSMKPPAQCYKEFIENGKLEDDCDGYHALLYHILTENRIECALATAVPTNKIIDGHTFLAFRLNSHICIVDYSFMKSYNTDFENAIQQYYNERHNKRGATVVYAYNVYDKNKKLWAKYGVDWNIDYNFLQVNSVD